MNYYQIRSTKNLDRNILAELDIFTYKRANAIRKWFILRGLGPETVRYFESLGAEIWFTDLFGPEMNLLKTLTHGLSANKWNPVLNTIQIRDPLIALSGKGFIMSFHSSERGIRRMRTYV